MFSEASVKNAAEDFQKKIGKAGNAKAAENLIKSTTGKTRTSSGYNLWLDEQIRNNASTINSVA